MKMKRLAAALAALTLFCTGTAWGEGKKTMFEKEWYLQAVKDSVMSAGNNARLKKVIDRARNGEQITLATIGGSITEGAGASTYKECWASRLAVRFGSAYGVNNGANVKLVNELLDVDLKNTLYFIPFASPKSTMYNERTFNDMDLNRSAHIKNSLSNLIVQAAENLAINFVGDFHSTAFNANPGIESVFSSKSPSPESYLIANYISRNVGSEVISFDFAGSSYKGAVEDVCNLKKIPAVTCEVLCPFANVIRGSVETSLAQMKSFLDYFGI